MFPDRPESLWQRAQGGDEQAYGLLLEEFRDSLGERVDRLLRGRPGVERGDVVQTVLLRALRSRGDFDWDYGQRQEFLAWLTSIAKNRVLDLGRKQAPSQVHTAMEAALNGGDTSISERASRRERAELLDEALAHLREDEARVLELRQGQGLPFEEIGRLMDRSGEAARKLHTRALVRLGRMVNSGLDGSLDS